MLDCLVLDLGFIMGPMARLYMALDLDFRFIIWRARDFMRFRLAFARWRLTFARRTTKTHAGSPSGDGLLDTGLAHVGSTLRRVVLRQRILVILVGHFIMAKKNFFTKKRVFFTLGAALHAGFESSFAGGHFRDWYLVVPCKSTSKPVVPSKSVCALDPGVRTFQTLYSPTEIIKFQQNKLPNDKKNAECRF